MGGHFYMSAALLGQSRPCTQEMRSVGVFRRAMGWFKIYLPVCYIKTETKHTKLLKYLFCVAVKNGLSR